MALLWHTASILYELMGFVATVLFIVYIWFQYKFSYWSNKGVSGPKPGFPFGNIEQVIKKKSQFFEPYCDSYFKYKHLPYVGMYTFCSPVLCVIDPDVMKLILIKDFDHFQSHGTYAGGYGDPLAGHLFNIAGQRWKNLRSKMSPIFSLAKLKTMYPLIEDIANESLEYVDSQQPHAIDFTDFYNKVSLEITGSVGFAVKCNGFKDAKSDFYVMGNKYFDTRSRLRTCARALAFFTPDVFDMLKIKRISPTIISFFRKLVSETVEYRDKNNYRRNDFLQTLIELKNGKIVNEKGEIKHIANFPFTMTDVAANAMLYMFAGYETSATTGQFAAYELAVNPHVQAKARDEIQRVLAKYNGECTFEAQNEMVYLNMVIDETLRMHPPLRALFRRCTKEYKMPHTDLVIEEGTLIFIPNQSIQMDPEIFPQPEKFDPERFSPENKAKLHPCHWMPFGEGPRKCLGVRQGYIQSKMALVKILSKYEILLDDQTIVPIVLKTSSHAAAPEGGMWLRLRRLDSV